MKIRVYKRDKRIAKEDDGSLGVRYFTVVSLILCTWRVCLFIVFDTTFTEKVYCGKNLIGTLKDSNIFTSSLHICSYLFSRKYPDDKNGRRSWCSDLFSFSLFTKSFFFLWLLVLSTFYHVTRGIWTGIRKTISPVNKRVPKLKVQYGEKSFTVGYSKDNFRIYIRKIWCRVYYKLTIREHNIKIRSLPHLLTIE